MLPVQGRARIPANFSPGVGGAGSKPSKARHGRSGYEPMGA